MLLNTSSPASKPKHINTLQNKQQPTRIIKFAETKEKV